MPRLASVTLALLGWMILLGPEGRVEAGDHCHTYPGDCNSQVIQLPAQQVVVETARPRVIVQETKLKDKHLHGARPEAVVATVFAPLALPVAVVAAPPPPPDGRAPEISNLQLAHQMEASMVQLQRARAAYAAEMAATQRVFERVSASMRTQAAADTAAETDLTKLDKQIKDLADRLDRLEKLVTLHGQFLQRIHESGVLEPKTAPKPMPK